MTRRGYANDMAAEGFRVFRCKPRSKQPAAKRWPSIATNDAATVRDWFADDVHNIGVYAGERIVGGVIRHMVVIDLDTKGGKDGHAALGALAPAHDGLPDTFTIRTPSGGLHLYFHTSRAIGTNANMLAPGVDVRGVGGYVVGPGSEVDGGAYTVAEAHQLADCPAWLEALLPHPGTKLGERGKRAALPGIDPERATARAVAYLAGLDAVTEGGRNHAAFAAAAKVKDLGCGQDECQALMLEHWPCEPMLEPEELAVTIASAYRNGQNPQGAAAPEAQFEPVEPDDNEPQAEHPLRAINEQWAIAAEAPKVVVYRERRHGTTGQKVFEAFHKAGFMDLHADRMFDGKPLALAWWNWPGRRIYPGGVEFAPLLNLPHDTLNLWGGFAVQPAPGDWSLMKDHIRDVICGGDRALHEYVLDWLARMVQRPGEPGQVAIVLRGDRGTGKGTLGEALLDLVGLHGIHLNDPKQLTGQFTGHLAGKVFVFSDEAVFAGDHSSVPRLKAMITERRVPMERKGIDIVQVRNCAHVLMASNDDWVVPAGEHERRFCVIDVSSHRRGDIPYFGAIRAQMAAGGLAAMLHELQTRDISAFDVYDFPHTAAEVDQQLATMDGKNGWLRDALLHGWVAGAEWSEHGALVSKSAAYDDYVRHSQAQREYRPEKREAFWKYLRKVMGEVGAVITTSQTHGGERSAGLPPLSQAREAFERMLGRKLSWSDD